MLLHYTCSGRYVFMFTVRFCQNSIKLVTMSYCVIRATRFNFALVGNSSAVNWLTWYQQGSLSLRKFFWQVGCVSCDCMPVLLPAIAFQLKIVRIEDPTGVEHLFTSLPSVVILTVFLVFFSDLILSSSLSAIIMRINRCIQTGQRQSQSV